MASQNEAFKKGDNENPQEEREDAGVRIFTVRVPVDLVGLMDEAVSESLVIKSRNTWIVNAINEQLKREGKA